MTIGLDLGSYEFRSIRSVDEKLIARGCPAVFTALADSPAHRRLLQQSNTQFATCSGHLLVFGDAASEWAAMLNLPLTELLRGGRIPTADPISRQVLALMMDAILPAADAPGSVCRMTLPGGGQLDRSENRDAEFFVQLVALRGYRPQLMTATHALALAEFHDAAFTGITISMGHTTSEFGVVHCGREIVRCVVMSGLSEFAGSPPLGMDAGITPESATVEATEKAYARFFSDIVSEARLQFEQDGTLKTLSQTMPVVCAGGITRSPDFLPLFQRAWNEAKWPVSTRPIHVASDANLSIARGCFIQAELDRPSERQVA